MSTSDSHFMQQMADNVDHNTATIDGFNNFHRMGIIAAITPAVKSGTPILRKTDVQLEQVATKARIDFRYHKEDISGLATLKSEGLHTGFIAFSPA